jgi:putative phosphonate metabolism protein
MTARYAIYFAPVEESALHLAGSRWLGYDASRAELLSPPVVGGLSEAEWRSATEAPRKYGFHATLKPPFRMADGALEADLVSDLAAFAARRAPVRGGNPVLSELDGFLALTPGDRHAAIAQLAADCVAAFDGFRAPPDDGELDRRRAAGLTPAQEALLRRWGYPYVMESFRFHMTLTGRLEDAARARFRTCLEDLFAPVLSRPLTLDSLCLFVQPSLDVPFELRERFLFGG